MITSFTGGFSFLSNFDSTPFTAPTAETRKPMFWKSGEAYFQAHKADNEANFERIAASTTPSEAKYLGRRVSLRHDWESIKYKVMKECLAGKFAPGSDLAHRLVKTVDQYLIEGNTWNDKVWGAVWDGHEWLGENWLGILLIHQRNYLRFYNTLHP